MSLGAGVWADRADIIMVKTSDELKTTFEAENRNSNIYIERANKGFITI